MKLPSHLGGHSNKTHLDKGALKWARKELGVNSIIDVGCGPGGMVGLALTMGIDSIGVDGDFTLDRGGDVPCIIHDYTSGVCSGLEDKKFDLAWSVEFLEHVEEKYIPNYMDTFQKARYVICTHAPIDCPGIHHVNCQNEDYWIDKFAAFGFEYLLDETLRLRESSSMNIDRPTKKQFVKNTGKVFKNK
jgi:hypothetical protein